MTVLVQCYSIAPCVQVISVPLYWSRSRERLLAMLDLPSGGEDDRWLQAGVCLFIRQPV